MPVTGIRNYYIPGGRKSFVAIAAATLVVSWLHFGEAHSSSVLHFFHYYFFYLIVIYAAHAFGFLGGLLSAFVLSLIYHGRLYLFGEMPADIVRPLVEMVMMYTLGVFSGLFSQKLYLEKEKLLQMSDDLRRSLGVIEQNAAERIRLEKEIARTDRLRVLGQLTAGIAHEIRNPLAAIRSGVMMLRQGKGGDEVFGIVTAEIDRLNAFVERFLQYARVGKGGDEKIDVRPFVDELAELLRLLAKDRSGVSVNVDNAIPGGASLRGDRNYLKQAFLNLLVNAIEAVEETGDEGAVTFSAAARESDILFTVADTGRGIPADRHERVFEPFYTTKEVGTGLGLTIAAKVIREHGGDIRIVPNGGTRFVITIPAESHEDTAC